MLKSIEWNKGKPKILDQLLLPQERHFDVSENYRDTAEAIRSMKLRGAPAIGVAAAFGMAQAAMASKAKDVEGLQKDLKKAGDFLKATRPTAVNLAWAVDRMIEALHKNRTSKIGRMKEILVNEALEVEREDAERCDAIAKYGEEVIRDGDRILTHCNTGALATAGVGTALGVIKKAHASGKKIKVWVDETRPYFQGARLTTFELADAKIEHSLVTDNSAALLMSKKLVDLVIVGADRITSQGDVANKIGTYGLAIIAKEHKVPFYVAAPLSTIDLSLKRGEDIPIEERDGAEVLMVNGKSIAPKGTKAAHFAFDVTPGRLINAIITEKGILRSPFEFSLSKALEGEQP